MSRRFRQYADAQAFPALKNTGQEFYVTINLKPYASQPELTVVATITGSARLNFTPNSLEDSHNRLRIASQAAEIAIWEYDGLSECLRRD